MSLFKDSNLDCNCPWMECAHHPQALCPDKASEVDCPNHDESHAAHYLGEGSLGDDVHICTGCASALMNVFMDEIVDLMQDLHEFVPKWLYPLESMCRHTYKSRLVQGGWEKPQADADAILALAYVVVTLDDYRGKSIPTSLIIRLSNTKKKVTDITNAYELGEKGVGVHE